MDGFVPLEVAMDMGEGCLGSLEPCRLVCGGSVGQGVWYAGPEELLVVKCFSQGDSGTALNEYRALERLYRGGAWYVPRPHVAGKVVMAGHELPAIVEERVFGYDLYALRKLGFMTGDADAAFGVSVASAIVLEVARAVEHMRRLGVCHLDLSPRNVIILDASCRGLKPIKESVYLVDFGCSRIMSDQAMSLVGAWHTGTVPFAAPEVFEPGQRDPTWCALADEWSLGALLTALVCGEWASPRIVALSRKRMLDPLKDFEEIRREKSVPIDLLAILGRADGLPTGGEVKLASVIRGCTMPDPAERMPLERVICSLEMLAER